MKENGMKNVYDIKREKNLNFILPKKLCLPGAVNLRKHEAAVVIHLHYAEKIKEYYPYLSNIPLEMDIIFTTSEEEVRKELEEYGRYTGQNIRIMEKKNRGRDISGLLVACQEELMKYKYICFTHDKKAKSTDSEKDVEIFIRCLWENTLGSNAYIRNVVHTLETNSSLGLLLPPESFSEHYTFAHVNTWDRNFALMETLAKRLKLHCDLDPQKKPLSLGTVFWAKTDALGKLFEENWGYEDFDQEPLPIDGTISHAIERSLAYVAQDAGYETGIVMTDEFAGERQDAMQDVMTEAFDLLKAVLGIRTIGELRRGNQTYGPMMDFAKSFPKLYVYGAGVYGQVCIKMLSAGAIEAKGFVVSKKEEAFEERTRLPILELSELVLDDKTGIIIAVHTRYWREITEAIYEKDAEFKNLFYFFSSGHEAEIETRS